MWDSLLVNFLIARCPRCATPSLRGLCEACKQAPSLLSQTPLGLRIVALAPYDSPVGESVRLLKYQGQSSRASFLASALAHFNPTKWHRATLAPVPLHTARLVERGFNQSALLARGLASQSGQKLEFTALKRQKLTSAQASLNREKRRDNLLGAFHCTKPLNGLRIVLVDDVVTTGSTLDACAQILKESGAEVLGALCCAIADKSLSASG